MPPHLGEIERSSSVLSRSWVPPRQQSGCGGTKGNDGGNTRCMDDDRRTQVRSLSWPSLGQSACFNSFAARKAIFLLARATVLLMEWKTRRPSKPGSVFDQPNRFPMRRLRSPWLFFALLAIRQRSLSAPLISWLADDVPHVRRNNLPDEPAVALPGETGIACPDPASNICDGRTLVDLSRETAVRTVSNWKKQSWRRG